MIPTSPLPTLRAFPVVQPHITSEHVTGVVQTNGAAPASHSSNSASASAPSKSAVVTLPGANAQVRAFAMDAGAGFDTPAQQVSQMIAARLQKEWNQTIDPDQTRIVTLNYELGKPKPADAKVLNEITLTHAALSNQRSMNVKDEHPSIEGKAIQDLIETSNKSPLISPFSLVDQFEKVSEVLSPKYEYIIAASSDDSAVESGQVISYSPKTFRDLVWETDLVGPYKSYLDTFWATHEKGYSKLGKIALAQAAYTQFQEGSLSAEESALVMKASGLRDGKAWPDVTVADLQAPYMRPAHIEVGTLSINGDQTSDLMYIVDKTVKTSSTGEKTTTTLLHIPGNSSPIHRFDSPEALKDWLADQAADPIKRAALLTHFKRNDQDDKVFSDGVNQALIGLGGWRESQTPNALGFVGLNAWDPQRYISLKPMANDPFEGITQKQKERSYADADHDITTDRDVTKSAVIKVAEATAAAAMMMSPLALVLPEVAVALDVAYVAAGITEVGVGIDDRVAGKSKAVDRMVFGVLNAIPGVAHGASNAAETAVGEAVALEAPSHVAANTAAEVEEVFSDEAGPTALQRVTFDTSVKDLNFVDDTFFTFVDIYKGSDRLNIVVHGRELSYLEKKYALPTDAMLNGFKSTPEELQERLWGESIEPEEYQNVRLIMCYSGNGGDESFASKFHQLIGRPVKAYVGPIEAVFNTDEVKELYEKALASKRGIKGLERALTREDQPVVVKDGSSKSPYRPVHFPLRTG